MSRAESMQELIDRALTTGEPQRLSDEARDRFMAEYRARIAPIIDAHRAWQRRMLNAWAAQEVGE